MVTVNVDGEQWTEATDLQRAGPADRVFAVTADGRVVFGDGQHGAQPPAGSAVSVTYRTGVGSHPSSQVAMTVDWPPTPSRITIAQDHRGVAFSSSGDEVEQFNGATRVNYFDGQLLDAGDFNQEQQYTRHKRHLHNRLLHGWGIVSGLGVGMTSGQTVTVEPGLALDPFGREVCVSEPVSVTVTASRSPQFVIVSYRERSTNPVPVAGGDGTRPTRIEEGASVRIAATRKVDEDLAIARIVRGPSGWRVDRAFRPRRVRK